MIFSYSISLALDRYYLLQRSQINNKPIPDISRHDPVICQIYLLDGNNIRIRRCLVFGIPANLLERDIFFERANANGLPQERAMNITKNLGMLLLAIYLILIGISALIHTLAIPVIVTGILALAAGILILIGR